MSKGDDPRTIWGSSDESLYDNSVVDEDYEPSGTDLEESFSEIESPENDVAVIQPLSSNC